MNREHTWITPVKTADRFFVGHDNSGHEYFVPVSRTDEWYAWVEIPEDDERSWEAPGYAGRIDGRFTFTDPRCE